MPGTTSFLTRNAGTEKSRITSSEVIVSLMGWLTGTCSSLISSTPSGCCNFHIHCLPTTKISVEALGGREFRMNRLVPHKNTRNPSGNLGLSTDSSRDLIRVEVCALHPLRPSWLGASEESAPND